MTSEPSTYVYTQTQRNPSPPPLTDNERESISADQIGDTLFSKKFVLTLLLKLYQHSEEEIYDKTQVQGDDENDTAMECLQPTFEHEVCELWDSSSNSEVAMFIFINQGKDILLDVVQRTTSPRLTEISFGILANLSCVESIGECFSQDASFRTTMLGYLCITDALSLVELTRLIYVTFMNTETLPLWIRSISETSAMENIITILQNSLNVQLLQHIIQIIDCVFDSNSDLMDKYANSSLLYAVGESYHVVRTKNQELIPDLLYILQLVSTTEKGVEQLAADNSTFTLLNLCINDLQNLFVEEKPSLLVSVYSVLGCLLYAKPNEISNLINENVHIIEYLITILHRRVGELVESEEDNTLEYENESYVPVYLEILHDLSQIVCSHEENDYSCLLACLESRELHIKSVFELCNKENVPEEWKKFVTNMILLNQEQNFLGFIMSTKY